MFRRVFVAAFVTGLNVACTYTPVAPSPPEPPAPGITFVVSAPPQGAQINEGSVIEFSFEIYRNSPGGIVAEIYLTRDDGGFLGPIDGGKTNLDYLIKPNGRLPISGFYPFYRGHVGGVKLVVAELGSAEAFNQCTRDLVGGCTVAHATELGAQITQVPFEGNWTAN
ncbi:MAG: hypothetical protein HYT64_00990 [Candidatus Yanofskybacteria bacterium]|nr:hypothetical protein [Candidatus Yanofskybacteria bacterium]